MTERIESELLAYAELVDLSSPQEMARKIKQVAGISGARVTLVDAGGNVYADSEKDIAGLENHLNRPGNSGSEASRYGEGYPVQSDFIGRYALCRRDDQNWEAACRIRPPGPSAS